jgi:hypothetical protein
MANLRAARRVFSAALAILVAGALLALDGYDPAGPSPRPRRRPRCPARRRRPRPRPRLSVVDAGGRGARLREGPSDAASVVAVLPDGAEVAESGAEVDDGGRTWRRVTGPDGTAGWVDVDLLGLTGPRPRVGRRPPARRRRGAGAGPAGGRGRGLGRGRKLLALRTPGTDPGADPHRPAGTSLGSPPAVASRWRHSPAPADPASHQDSLPG